MSLKLNFAALSVGASVDQQTGSLSVFDVIEEIRVPQVPVQLQSAVISVAWEKTRPMPYEGRVFIHVLSPDGQQAMIGNGDLKIPQDQKRLKAVFRLGGFPLIQWGAHRFVVSWLNSQGVKEGEAILDYDVIQVPGGSEGSPESEPGGSSGTPPAGSGRPTTH